MSAERGLTACSNCKGRGERITGRTNGGQAITTPCQPCGGSGFLPTVRGNVISWKSAYGILDRERPATPVAENREQGQFL